LLDSPTPGSFYGVEEYRGFVSRVGLSPERIALIPKDMVHDGKEALKGWVRTVFLPYTGRLPEALREILWNRSHVRTSNDAPQMKMDTST